MASPRSMAWFSSSRFSASVSTIAWAPSPAISWFQSSTPCSTVIVGNVAGSTSWGTRPRTSSASVTTTLRAVVPATNTPSPATNTAAPTSPMRDDPLQDRRRRIAAGGDPCRESAEAVVRRGWCRDDPVEERTSRAHHDQAAEQGDLRAELGGLRAPSAACWQRRRGTRTGHGRHVRRARSSGR